VNKNSGSKIYTVTGFADISCHRCFGWFMNLKDAQKAVVCNKSDLHEYLYEYMVIEEVQEGIFCKITQEIWYRWHDRKRKFLKSSRPHYFPSNVVNFGIG